MTSTVFLSAVSSEFATLRQQLASSLRRAGWTVVFHDELRYGKETLLADLDAEIARAEACVCVLGQRSGGGCNPGPSPAKCHEPDKQRRPPP